MMDKIETYILENYTSPNFPQSYESFLKENYKDIVPDLILGDEYLTDITNKVIKGEEVDDSYLGTFKNYYGESVYEPEVDFTKALAIQARYIDDAEYLEWLNDDKMAKVLAEYPTRADLIDHLGPTIEDIAEKYGNDPNLDLLINNMTYKSHPLAFYEFSQSDDFSEQDGDFGFRDWIRKGLNSIKRITTRNKNENTPSQSTDASSDDSLNLTKRDLKDIVEHGTPEQQELAKEILDQKSENVSNNIKASKSIVTDTLSGELPLKASNALSPGVRTQKLVQGKTLHDPNVVLLGQIKVAGEMSEKEAKTTEDKVIEVLKNKKSSGELKLQDVPKGKDHSIPLGPATDNPEVNSRLKDRPNEFSEGKSLEDEVLENELIRMKLDLNKKSEKKDRMYTKVRSFLTSGDMDGIEYQDGDWIPDRKLRKAAKKYESDLQSESYRKSIKNTIDKKYGKSDSKDIINTVARVAAPIIMAKASANRSNSKDQELEKLRLENENLKLKQQMYRPRGDYSEGQDFDNPYDDAVEDHNHKLEKEHKDSNPEPVKVDEKKESVSGEPSPEVKVGIPDDPKPEKSTEELANPEHASNITPEVGQENLKGPRWVKDEDRESTPESKPTEAATTEQTPKSEDKPTDSEAPKDSQKSDEPKKPRTSRKPKEKLTEDQQLENAEKAAAADERAKKLGMHFEDDGKGGRKLVKDEPKTETPFATKSKREVKRELKDSGTWKNLTHAQRRDILAENKRNNRVQTYRNARSQLGLSNSNSNSSGNSTSSSSKSGGDSFSKLADAARSLYSDIKKDKKKMAFANGVKGIFKGIGSGLKTAGNWIFNSNSNQAKYQMMSASASEDKDPNGARWE